MSSHPITYSYIISKGPWVLTKTTRRRHLISIYKVLYLEALRPRFPSVDREHSRVCSIAQHCGPRQESQGLESLRQEDEKFETSVNSIVRPCLQQTNNSGKKRHLRVWKERKHVPGRRGRKPEGSGWWQTYLQTWRLYSEKRLEKAGKSVTFCLLFFHEVGPRRSLRPSCQATAFSTSFQSIYI